MVDDTKKPIRLMVVCPAFRWEQVLVRWKLLAERYAEVTVTVVGPDYWESSDFGKRDIYPGLLERQEGRFRFVTVNMRRNWLRGGWFDRKIFTLVKECRPDIIYLIGEEGSNVLFQMAVARRLSAPQAKILAFTMRELPYPFRSFHFRLRWLLAKRVIDAYLCHHPKGVERLRGQGGFSKPVYMQTQIGVDAQFFRPSPDLRISARDRWGVRDDEFIFGTLSRIDIQKGVLDVVDAMQPDAPYKVVLIGDGVDVEKVKAEVERRGLGQRILMPGRVPFYGPVAEVLNGLDAFIHVPRTTPTWIDTFPLAVVQAMAVGLPVIGSNSGAVPYQLGPDSVIVPQGDSLALREAMDRMVGEEPPSRLAYGERLRQRAIRSFEISHLTDCFYAVMKDILAGRVDSGHFDQQDFRFDEAAGRVQ